MKKNPFVIGAVAVVVIICLFCFIGVIRAGESKCIQPGCDNKQADGSSYCYLHKSSSRSRSSYGSSSHSSESTATNSSSYNRATKSSIATNVNPHESYDEGYDDVYMDDVYDDDRYNSDSDYADGVNDAMDELGEDW